jgi:hypothetical protein
MPLLPCDFNKLKGRYRPQGDLHDATNHLQFNGSFYIFQLNEYA